MKRLSDDNDKDLIRRMAQGDARAFTAIYHQYWKMVFSIAAKKLRNLHEAEELTQDIFLDLWKRRESLEIHTCLSSYISVALNYKVLKVLARRQLFLKYSNTANHPPAVYAGSLLEFEDVKQRLMDLVAELPVKCKTVFQLSRFEEMSGREIAQRLSISEKTVESHITKALRHLKTGLGMLPILLFFIRR